MGDEVATSLMISGWALFMTAVTIILTIAGVVKIIIALFLNGKVSDLLLSAVLLLAALNVGYPAMEQEFNLDTMARIREVCGPALAITVLLYMIHIGVHKLRIDSSTRKKKGPLRTAEPVPPGKPGT